MELVNLQMKIQKLAISLYIYVLFLDTLRQKGPSTIHLLFLLCMMQWVYHSIFSLEVHRCLSLPLTRKILHRLLLPLASATPDPPSAVPLPPPPPPAASLCRAAPPTRLERTRSLPVAWFNSWVHFKLMDAMEKRPSSVRPENDDSDNHDGDDGVDCDDDDEGWVE